MLPTFWRISTELGFCANRGLPLRARRSSRERLRFATFWRISTDLGFRRDRVFLERGSTRTRMFSSLHRGPTPTRMFSSLKRARPRTRMFSIKKRTTPRTRMFSVRAGGGLKRSLVHECSGKKKEPLVRTRMFSTPTQAWSSPEKRCPTPTEAPLSHECSVLGTERYHHREAALSASSASSGKGEPQREATPRYREAPLYPGASRCADVSQLKRSTHTYHKVIPGAQVCSQVRACVAM